MELYGVLCSTKLSALSIMMARLKKLLRRRCLNYHALKEVLVLPIFRIIIYCTEYDHKEDSYERKCYFCVYINKIIVQLPEAQYYGYLAIKPPDQVMTDSDSERPLVSGSERCQAGIVGHLALFKMAAKMAAQTLTSLIINGFSCVIHQFWVFQG